MQVLDTDKFTLVEPGNLGPIYKRNSDGKLFYLVEKKVDENLTQRSLEPVEEKLKPLGKLKTPKKKKRK